MRDELYEMIFKRKSFHLFRDTLQITKEDLQKINEAFPTLIPLVKDIQVKIRIVPASETNCKRGEEYCILFYSEEKDNYLPNIGYIGEQLDLYLASLNIGTLWFGIGRSEEVDYDGLKFVIMMGISKMQENTFRKDMFKSKRKPVEEIWQGDAYTDIANIVRFAPSACNTQPWFVESSKDKLEVYRYKKEGKRGIMPINKVIYYNRIDIGVFLCFLELCFQHNSIVFERMLLSDLSDNQVEYTQIVTYQIKGREDK